MIKTIVAFKKAVAKISFKKAIAELKFGDFLIFRFFFDVLGLSDSQSKSIGKSLGDSSITSDLALKGLSKPANDGSATADAQTFSLGKALSDFSAMTDVKTASFNKGNADGSSFADAEIKDFHKFINEQAGVTDDLDGEASADDDQTMTFVKVRSDLAAMTDILSIVKAKLLSDTSAAADSGSYRGQGYAAFDYFASDYVGYSGTF
tara:strand:+ start:174 stop:791 length:618 start_codon:yes stop_codon:yes gene_type:complete